MDSAGGRCSMGSAIRLLCAAGSLLALAACSWVDDTGIQSNESPDIQLDAANAATEGASLRWPFSLLDPDGNIQRVDVTLQAEGRQVASCGAWFTPLESADSLRDACQPSLSDAQCQVGVVTGSDDVRLNFPELRYPVGLTYDLSVLDTGLQSTSRTVDICVQTVSAPPVAQADAYSVTYGSVLATSAVQWGDACEVVGGTGVLANDTDDFDYTETTNSGAPCLTAELVSAPQFATRFSLAADGSFQYEGSGTVGPGGSDSFSYRANDGVNVSEPVQVALSIVGDNLPPIANTLSRSIDEDTVLTVPITALGQDPEGLSLRVAALSRPSQGSAEIRGDAVVYRPPAGYSGSTRIGFTLADVGGATAEGTLTVTVLPVNDPPEILSLTDPIVIQVINPGSPAGVTVDARVRDDETPAPLLVVSADIDPSFARAAVSSTDTEGRVSIVISPLRNGTETLEVSVRDTGFAGLSAETTSRAVQVQVDGVNEAPIAGDDTATTNKGVPVDIAVLANDSDPDGQSITLIGVVTSPSNGSAVLLADGQTLRYTPRAGFSGNDLFTYRVRDPLGAETVGTVRVQVINQAPAARSDSYQVEGIAPTALPVLLNDADPDGDPVRITRILNSPAGIVLTVTGDTILFRSITGAQAEVEFSYEIDDFDGLTSQAVVSVRVSEQD
ncbi:MAG: Ig-like domain-containing protein, partial [Pseudomonadota bacterium]